MAEVSFLRFSDEQHVDDSIDHIINLDSLGSVAGDRKNQVNFVMDLFHQRVEQSHVRVTDQFVSEHVNGSSFGIIDEMGINFLNLELGLGLGMNEISDDEDVDNDYDDDYGCGGFVVSDCGDDFFMSTRDTSRGCDHVSESRIGGLSVVGIDSDSEEEGDEEGNDLLGVDMQSEEGDFGIDNGNDDGLSIGLCWDSLQLDDHGEGNNDFEWEEIDDDSRVDEREVLSVVADPDEEESISILPMMGPEEDGPWDQERGREFRDLEWEVLLNVNNLERNNENEDGGSYLVDPDFYTAEYEMMFGQFPDGENAYLTRPPASKSVVERLPTVVMTENEVLNDKSLCAICKDHIDVGEKGKELPCCHVYHGECILPWLEIRNTCPVCRHELPTDDTDYEQRRLQRAARGL